MYTLNLKDYLSQLVYQHSTTCTVMVRVEKWELVYEIEKISFQPIKIIYNNEIAI